MMKPLHGLAREEGGQAILLMAGTMLALLMMVGIAVDAGQLYSAKRTMQEAADAAAFGGAVVLYQQGTTAEARNAAIADATRNTFTQGINTVVEVNSPPLSGLYAPPHVNASRYVEVIITAQVQTALVPSQAGLTTVRVRGVAGAEPLNNAYAIMSLDTSATGCAFSTSPNADVHLTGGGILVNSSSASAACNSQTTAARFTITPAPPNGVDIVGNTGSSWPPGMSVDIAQPQQADPFAGFPKPSTAGVPVYNAIPGGSPTVLQPGVWNVALSAGGGTTLWLDPGIYILKAGINAAGNADLVSKRTDTTPACASNCGVFIFNTHSNYPGAFRTGIDSCGPLSLVGNSASDLRAQTTGTYANFLFYQDPACTNEMVIAGNGTFNGTGTIYLPNAPFRFDGNPSTLNGSQLIAKTVDVQNGNLTINFNAGTSAQPILPRLAE